MKIGLSNPSSGAVVWIGDEEHKLLRAISGRWDLKYDPTSRVVGVEACDESRGSRLSRHQSATLPWHTAPFKTTLLPLHGPLTLDFSPTTSDRRLWVARLPSELPSPRSKRSVAQPQPKREANCVVSVGGEERCYCIPQDELFNLALTWHERGWRA